MTAKCNQRTRAWFFSLGERAMFTFPFMHVCMLIAVHVDGKGWDKSACVLSVGEREIFTSELFMITM